MKIYNDSGISTLKEKLVAIVVDDSKGKSGFTVVLELKGGKQKTYPGTLTLLEAITIANELGEAVGLPEEEIIVNKKSIDKNRLNDLAAYRISKIKKIISMVTNYQYQT